MTVTTIALVVLGVAGWYAFDRERDGSGSGKEQSVTRGTEAKETVPWQTVDLKDGDSYDLVIAPAEKVIDGRKVRMLAYNGSVPGPALRVPQGATVTINLKNEGDIATTLHAHGVRMDNAFDGVPGMTQEEIAPGGSFAYTLKFPDAGAFWYHPHVRTDYALESGLYGSIIVTPEDAAYWPEANRDLPLMLDDIALDKTGLLSFDKETVDHTLMGRFGNVMLVNGETGYRFEAKRGEVVRLHLTNAANTRLFNFVLPGARMKLIGADSGRFAKERFTDEILVAPGERRIADVYFEKAGEYRMEHRTPEKTYALGAVSVMDEVAEPSFAEGFSKLRVGDDEPVRLVTAFLPGQPDKSLSLTLDMAAEMRQGMPHGMHSMGGMAMSDEDMGMGDDGDALEWEDQMAPMNARSTSGMMTWKLVDTATGKANLGVDDWKFREGDKVKIRLFNDPRSMHPMQHPIHFHGQRFLVLSTNGVRNDDPVWLDTALIAKGDTVDILLDASNPGEWMAHCHILEHAESGMMLPFTVEKAPVVSGKSDAVRTIDLVATNWYFDPEIIAVKQGERVRLRIRATGRDHGIAIPAYGIERTVRVGTEETVELTADKKGTFPFSCPTYCGDGHASMSGILRVD